MATTRVTFKFGGRGKDDAQAYEKFMMRLSLRRYSFKVRRVQISAGVYEMRVDVDDIDESDLADVDSKVDYNMI